MNVGCLTTNFQGGGHSEKGGLLTNYYLKCETLVNYGLLKWDPCEPQERREEGVFRVAHPNNPFRSIPPTPIWPKSQLSEAVHGCHGNQNKKMYRFWIFGIWAFIWNVTLHNWVSFGKCVLEKGFSWAPNTRPPLMRRVILNWLS